MIPILDEYVTNQYIRAFVVFLVVGLSLRVLLYLAEKLAVKFTSKTKTDIDDKLFERSSSPLTLLAILLALKVTLGELTFSEQIVSVLTNIIYSIIVVVLALLLYIIIDVVLMGLLKQAASKTKSNIDDSILSLFRSIMYIGLVVISFLYILSLWGVEITPLLAGLGIAGLAVALALQPILSNIFSGAAIVLDGTVRVGDLIYLDADTRGKIEKVGLRATRIKTFDNEYIIIPNNKLSDSNIQNLAQPEPKSRAMVPFGVAYGSDVDKVKKLVINEIKKIPHVEKDPEIVVRFTEMADSSLNFKAYYYVDSFENRVGTIDEANTRIYNTLNKAGIEIPFPQMDVNLKK